MVGLADGPHLPDEVTRLGNAAADRGLLEPVDFGEAAITDQGWVTATFSVAGVTVEHHIYAPDYTEGLDSEHVDARRRFNEFVAEVRAVVRTAATDPASTYVPEFLSVSAAPLPVDRQVDVTPSPWPFDTTARELFGATGYAPIPVEAAKRLLTVESWVRTPVGGRIAIVDTGLPVPRRLALTVGFPSRSRRRAPTRTRPRLPTPGSWARGPATTAGPLTPGAAGSRGRS
ncbi:hypothetical protein BH24ACT5_BH24ACT5_03990 [soil metagenome]